MHVLPSRQRRGTSMLMAPRSIADQLRALREHGVLVTMAESGLITELRCALDREDRCFCPLGPTHFDKKTHPPTNWAPSMDHYPKFKRDGGHRLPDNARLAHIRCNDLDFKWNELPEERRSAAVERWRKRYMEQSSGDP